MPEPCRRPEYDDPEHSTQTRNFPNSRLCDETSADSLHVSYQFTYAGRYVLEVRHQADSACICRCFVTRLSAARLVFARGDAAGLGGAGFCQREGASH